MQSGEYRLVYTTPESFYDRFNKEPRKVFMEMSREGKISVIALDEAHLITSRKSFNNYVCVH